ncbi:MAG: response regulator [Gammaproteobacteria bacterium]|nr:response regulator [Gammaproteobacteria bacterium]
MKNNYVIRVLDLPEHERVILKLIFLVSVKSNLRRNSYTLADTRDEPADVVIRDGHVAYTPSSDVRRELLVVNAPATTIDAPVVAGDPSNHQKNAASLLSSRPPAVAALASAHPDATEVAIVRNTTQEHPANQELAGIPAAQGAEVAAVVETLLLSTPSDDPEVDIFETQDKSINSSDAPEFTSDVKSRVLVVDDSTAVCKQLEIELLQYNVEIDYAPTARQAIEMLGKYNYKMAFLDVVLPDWDGYRICKHIKSKAPNTAVVMISGKTTASDKLRGALAGCDAYLMKPVARQTFQAAVKKYLPLEASSQAQDAVS